MAEATKYFGGTQYYNGEQFEAQQFSRISYKLLPVAGWHVSITKLKCSCKLFSILVETSQNRN